METLLGEEVHQVCTESISSIIIDRLTADMVAIKTDKDAELGPIKQDVLIQTINSPYILNYGILFKNERVVIPKNLQEQVLQELHATHIGMKQLARRYVFILEGN